jgi:hypothetical protein
VVSRVLPAMSADDDGRIDVSGAAVTEVYVGERALRL